MNKNNMPTRNWIFISCIVIISVSITSHFALGQNIKIKEQLTKQRGTIGISSTIVKQKKCSDGNIRLQVMVTVKNLSDKPIVFCKECMTDMGIYMR